MALKRFVKDSQAQATVELAVMFPVILIIAVIAVNALSFFSQCAKFDRVFKQMAVSLGSSPGYGQNLVDIRAEMDNVLKQDLDDEFLDFDVAIEGVSGQHQVISATLKMQPTLFGMGMRSEFFGIALPTLNHQQKIMIDVYKPGVIF